MVLSIKLFDDQVSCICLRQCAHSFSTSSIAFSTAFYGLAMGFALLLFMDELCACFQVILFNLCCLIGFYPPIIFRHALISYVIVIGLLFLIENTR